MNSPRYVSNTVASEAAPSTGPASVTDAEVAAAIEALTVTLNVADPRPLLSEIRDVLRDTNLRDRLRRGRHG